MKNDVLSEESKYLKTSRGYLEKINSFLEKLEKEENESKRLKLAKDALDKNFALLKSVENHAKKLKKLDQRHEEFYKDYARAFVQYGKQASYNVERGKKALTANKSAWQYGSEISITGSNKKKRNIRSKKEAL